MMAPRFVRSLLLLLYPVMAIGGGIFAALYLSPGWRVVFWFVVIASFLILQARLRRRIERPDET